ncbi:MAG: T9SS type A sorting domain-containing protein [Flavobacteriales bacterium]|nr:T9SS type A sorting domain-containing protein [Flavobacteriales bacterium]
MTLKLQFRAFGVFILVLCYSTVLSQGVPEILYYKFNRNSTSIINYASNPPSGTSRAQLNGLLTIGSSAACGSSALIGTGSPSSSDYIETNWSTKTTGSWTISFWTSKMDTTTSLFYIFSDINAGSFRCFTGGVAGAKNILLRGALNEVLLTGGATTHPSVKTFVYDSLAGYIYAYLDDKLVNSVKQGSIALSTSGSFILSGYNSLEGLNKGGELDEFRFYNRALTAAEIANFKYTGSSSVTIKDSVKCSYTSPSKRHVWTNSGTYKDTIPNAVNCDSILSINLIVYGSTASTLNITACDFYKSPSGKDFWTKTGTYTDIIPNSIGCDSVITVNLTIKNSKTLKFKTSSCGPFTSPSKKHIWTQSGNYVDTLMTKSGCDSFMVFDLTVHHTEYQSISVTECNSYSSPSGKFVWNKPGTYTDTLVTQFGCDSILTVNLKLNYDKTSDMNIVVCGSYRSPSKKYLYTQTGIYYDTLPLKTGCDSIVKIDLVVNTKTFGQLLLNSCDEAISPSGKYKWSVSGIYQDTLVNKKGCDSIVSIDLKIWGQTTSTSFANSCVRFLSPSGKYVWTKSGKYSDTIVNSKGCDSIMTLNVTIKQVNVDVTQNNPTLTAKSFSGTYQWLDCKNNYAPITGAVSQSFTATKTGEYAVQVTENSCTDTSKCYVVDQLWVDSRSNVNKVKTFPNPAIAEVFVQTETTLVKAEIKIYNLNGSLIHHSTNLYGTIFKFDVSNFEHGMYIVEINSENLQRTLRFIH